MNKFTKFVALALAAGGVVTLAACGTVRNVTSTSPNWNVRVVSRNDLTENSDWLKFREVATYSLSFENATNESYKFEYDNDGSAKYVTRFYAENYEWKNAPEGFGADKTEYVYVYETLLTLSGKINFEGQTKEFENFIYTVSKFRSADNNLQPVYSYQEIKNTAPANISAKTLEETYQQLDCTYETYFNENLTKAKIDCSDDTQDRIVDIPANYSVFDSAQLSAAFRSFAFDGSHLFDVFSAIEGATAQYSASFTQKSALDSEKEKQIADALDLACDSGYLLAGNNDEGKRVYNFNAMTLSKNSNMTGQARLFWFANVASNSINATRAVMLKCIEPLSFGQGIITYTLSSLEKEEI